MKGQKKNKKKVMKVMRTSRPRRVTRRLVRKVWMDRTGQIQHAPGPGELGGRIVCASRHPPRQIESLEAWALGGLKAGRNRKMAIL